MANMHLVTGFAGQVHITSDDQAAFHANALFGSGQHVLNVGNKLAASVITNNQIRILDGEIIMQGRYVRIDGGAYVDLNIDSGSQGYMRNDLIVARYTKNSASAVEEVNLVVIKGTPVASNPVDPAYTEGDILNDHVLQADMPLYRVPLDGINVQDLVPLFTVNTGNILEGKQDKTNLLATETSLEDGDSFPFFDVSANSHKNVLWSRIKAVLGSVFAKSDHTHSLSSIGAAAANHNHDASAIAGGILAVARGGTGVSSVEALSAALGTYRIATGSYFGAGNYGASYANSLTFPFAPKIVFIIPASAFAFIDGTSLSTLTVTLMNNTGCYGGNNPGRMTVSVSGNTITWYSADMPSQGNLPTTYHYVAFG